MNQEPNKPAVRRHNPPFPHCDATDAIIREGYKSVRVGPAHAGRCSIADIAAQLQRHTGRAVAHHVVECRARVLGLTRPKLVREWTEAEDRFIAQYAHLTSNAIRAKLARANPGKIRTRGEINLRRRQLVGETREHREDQGVFSPGYLAQVLGVRPPAIIGWVKAGWLKAEQAPCESKVEDNARPVRYLIREADLRRFIINNPTRVPLGRVDPVWFIPFVANRLGKRCGMADAA